jgi:dCTP deaminase
MAFWSGERLAQELPALISGFDPKKIDCANYQLCVGDQAFVTRDLHGTGPTDPLVSVLGEPPHHTIRIAPGQFAFLLTLEDVRVPDNAMALISMRARYKFKGLINVSGFHVDPGWQGKLLFSVYNAGPAEVILSKGEALFLIVYADLDQRTKETYNGSSLNQKSIDASLLQNMTTQVFSPQALQRQLDTVDAKMGRVELNIGIAAGLAAGLAVVTGIVVATVALLPSWAGVVIARTLDAANYEVKQKAETPTSGSADARAAASAPK